MLKKEGNISIFVLFILLVTDPKLIHRNSLVVRLYLEAEQPIFFILSIEHLTVKEHSSRSVAPEFQLLTLVQLYHLRILGLDEIFKE